MKAFVFALLLACSVPAFPSEVPSVDSATDAVVAVLVDSYAGEYRQARRIHYPQGKAGLAIVFFTIESFGLGNNHTQYLAVFEPSFKVSPEQKRTEDKISKYRLVGYLPVGGNELDLGSVDIDRVELDGTRITIHRKEYAQGDALCCPSIPNKLAIRISYKEIIQEARR